MPDKKKTDRKRDLFDRIKDGEKLSPDEYVSAELQARVQDEAIPCDLDAMERFKAAHDGMTPIEYAFSLHPSAAIAISVDFPHLLPKEKP